ncbi:sialate O-acetylesterase [Polaribacter atrinae]|uniref:sialate O-acetylesterase n=1 Tax=Polaribacter atrinae TaxID=1333662 RepID=UPI00248F5303|nr:sialate O-acetylesterase [Polaribacter atrinae]
MFWKHFYLFFIALYSSTTIAQTKLASFFSDNMVLQQKELVAIWGEDMENTTIIVSGSWGKKTKVKTDKNGNWKVKIQTPSAGGPYTIKINGSQVILLKNVLIGEVWVCSGQSNMQMKLKGNFNQPILGSQETILNSKNSQLRMFNTKIKASLTPLKNVIGKWEEASPKTSGNFSATAYYFGQKLQELLKVPVGLIHSSWGGSSAESWTDKEIISQFNSAKIPAIIPKKNKQKNPTLLYNGMLHPFIGYNIKGVIWYQGEANRNRANEYEQLISAMVSSWRSKWQNNFPFYFVQIAPFEYKNTNSAFLREAQLKTMFSLENSGMAVTMDIGECDNIHPSNKKLVGDRLAYWALSKNYKIEGISYSGPVYKKMQFKGLKAILTFDYAKNGFSGFGKKIQGFEIAGEDKVFHEALVKINRNKTITVWSDNVLKPKAVRYAFKNCVLGTLYNTEGLPASSFRTDNWEK